MSDTTPKSYSADPTLYLYTSLTAGSSHIITATSRLETILKANKIAFRALDVATDEKARMLWGRRCKGKKLPGLVQYGSIVGDLEEIEEWNEYGELKQQIGTTAPVATSTPPIPAAIPPSNPPTTSMPGSNEAAKDSSDLPTSSSQSDLEGGPGTGLELPLPSSPKKEEPPLAKAMRQAGAEAAKKAGEREATKSAVPPSVKGGKPSEAPMPTVEAEQANAVEEPSAPAETTAAKTPQKLAEEGTKRVDTDEKLDSGLGGNFKTSDVSSEDSGIKVNRTSGIIRTTSPLPEDTARSSVAAAQSGSTELDPAVPESSTVPSQTDSEVKGGIKPADLAASDEGELVATEGIRPQDGDARDGTAAGKSVGD